jgi:transposase-like protein
MRGAPMNSITLKEVLTKAACRISDSENLVYGELDSATASLSKLLLEAIAESEVERRLGARLHQRSESRTDHRNGYRKRQVQMSYQVVEIRIPRLRDQGFVPSFLEPNRRAIAEVEGWVAKAFLSGLSRAEVIRLLESTTGVRPSDNLLRRVQDELDKQVKAFRERILLGRYQYLFLDAAWAKDIVVASVKEDLGYLLAFYGCEQLHWKYVRTSNPIERVFRELRRQQFGCGAFANRDACNRAVFRVFNWLNELWRDKDIWQSRVQKQKKAEQAA